MKELPVYGRREEHINVISHLTATVLSVVGTVYLLVHSFGSKNTPQIIASLLFGASLIELYLMSTLYHNEKNLEKRRVRQKIDHLSINFLIAGSNTAFMVGAMANTKGYLICAAVWALSIISIVLNSVNVNKYKLFSMICYVVTGWAPIVVICDMYALLSLGGLLLLLGGGLFYTIGIVFYSLKKRGTHAIWHFFVIAGSLSHYLCYVLYVLK